MKKLVLIIDDVDSVRLALKNYLSELKCDVIEAENPEDAKQKLREYKDKLDVVILDLMLLHSAEKEGEESGLKILQDELGPPKICETCGFPCIKTKVIVLTAYSSVTSCRAAFLAGAYDYILKTSHPNVVVERVKDALR